MSYNILVVQRGAVWVAHAERAETGDRFGIEVASASEHDAVHRLTRWLEWQREHIAALEALQAAERAHLRAIADTAFLKKGDGSIFSASDENRPVPFFSATLREVDEARIRLDAIRARQPE